MRYDAGFLVGPARDEFDVGLVVILRTLGRGCASHDLRTEHKIISKARGKYYDNFMYHWGLPVF